MTRLGAKYRLGVAFFLCGTPGAVPKTSCFEKDVLQHLRHRIAQEAKDMRLFVAPGVRRPM
jgi:hypothetical protein